MDLPGPRNFSFAVVSLSGGKDSAAALHYTLTAWPRERVLDSQPRLLSRWLRELLERLAAPQRRPLAGGSAVRG